MKKATEMTVNGIRIGGLKLLNTGTIEDWRTGH